MHGEHGDVALGRAFDVREHGDEYGVEPPLDATSQMPPAETSSVLLPSVASGARAFAVYLRRLSERKPEVSGVRLYSVLMLRHIRAIFGLRLPYVLLTFALRFAYLFLTLKRHGQNLAKTKVWLIAT